MFNLIKRKNKFIQVKAYTTYDNGIHNTFPPTVSKQPKWVAKLKSFSPIEIARTTVDNETESPAGLNVKTCPGRMELYSRGIVIPLWSDLYIRITPNSETKEVNWKYQFADMRSKIEPHPYVQYETMAPRGKYVHFKLISPWNFVTDEDVDFVAIKPAWELDDLYGYEILPGIISFYHQQEAHVNMFIKAPEKEQEYMLKAGTPMYQFIPLSDRKIQLETKAVSPHDPEWRQVKTTPRYCFKKNYRKYRTSD